MKLLQRLLKLKDESGAAIVIAAIFMVALLCFTALAIDGGRVYLEKAKLQKALDAAVLAGAQGLRISDSQARSIANDVSEKNGYTESNISITSDSIKATKQIIATKQVTVPMTFAKVIGFSNVTVGASAKAMIAPLKKAGGIAPIAIEKKDVPSATIINCGASNPGSQSGNCGYLRIDGTGATDLGEAIKNGLTYEVGTPVTTETGQNTGPVGSAIDFLINSDAAKPNCQSPDTADHSCKRVITIVVIDTWDGVKGHDNVNVIGFASYWIDKYEDKKLYGKFIKMVSPGEIGSSTEIGDYQLYGVKLVE
ncbi:TadE/TadG family type IV pilus assembly protein [Neobacillus cucumis]|uniref:Putative Flp pilus-assembly TadG-like N-terminal domain-containing protein n=1 Tax=Neobacillus cucumis TaxID=1740721 RepID=A0A2N5HN26_9BACI|nr:TadE/TadG family type IV pilus assembly protein [Neobacillus cucumis]PLS06926.1 hypothetical protein CVD27_06580 [Neobacillus cucumis]